MKSFVSIIILVQLGLILHVTRVSAAGGTILSSDPVTNWGDWGPWSNCPKGYFVYAFRLKTAEAGGDDTALNGIELYCEVKGINTNKLQFLHPIRSSEGPFGVWGTNKYMCSNFATGFALRVESPQGTGSGDDTATNNLRLICNGGSAVAEGNPGLGDGQSWGEWRNAKNCPSGQYICGIRNQVEPLTEPMGWGDDTALNNVEMKCCDSSVNPW